MNLHENLSDSYPAVPASVSLARTALADFAARAGANPEQIEAIRLAASEALTNVVLHAYDGAMGPIHISAACTSGELWILVADDGDGLRIRTDSPGLGVGLSVIAHLSDDFALVNRSSGGTEVRMRFSLHSGDHKPTRVSSHALIFARYELDQAIAAQARAFAPEADPGIVLARPLPARNSLVDLTKGPLIRGDPSLEVIVHGVILAR